MIFIACGGKGSRMGTIAKSKQKSLLTISGYPFLGYYLNLILGFGFRRIYLLTGYHSESIIEFADKYFSSYIGDRLNVVYAGRDGNAYALFVASRFCKGKPFFFTDADVIFREALFDGMIKQFFKNKSLLTIGVTKENFAPTHSHLVIEKQRVVNILTGHVVSVSDGFCCISPFLFSPDVFGFLPNLKNLEDMDFVVEAVWKRTHNLDYFLYDGPCYALHDPKDLERLSQNGRDLLRNYAPKSLRGK